MASIMEKDVLIEKAAIVALSILKSVRRTGETTTTKADFSLICEARHYFLCSEPSDLDFACWVNLLNSIKSRYQ